MKIVLTLFTTIFSLTTFASTVLIVGDSHSVGPFGKTLHSLISKEGHNVELYASCGSIPQWWSTGKATTCGYLSINNDGKIQSLKTAPTPLIENLLTDLRPDTVIMEFGGNYAGYPSDDFVIKDIEHIISKVKNDGAKCVFVTNPDTRSRRDHLPRILDLIIKAVKDDCIIFESYKVTKYPNLGGDGIHYSFPAGRPIAESWAKAVFQIVRDSL